MTMSKNLYDLNEMLGLVLILSLKSHGLAPLIGKLQEWSHCLNPWLPTLECPQRIPQAKKTRYRDCPPIRGDVS